MSRKMQSVKEWLELVSSVFVILGVPIGLYQYHHATTKERLDREYGTYNALDEKYLEFLQLCMDRPYLDIFDVPDAKPAALTPEQKKQELIAFSMLLSIFERAHLMYADQSTEIKRRQWSGWGEYIRSYARRDNFRRAWAQIGTGFDAEFQSYMATVLDPPNQRQAPAPGEQ